MASTKVQKMEACVMKFGSPWNLNTKKFGHPVYNSDGSIKSYSPYVYLKGADAVSALSVHLNFARIYQPQLVQKIQDSIAFAQKNPTSLVPNPSYVASLTEFKPDEFEACIQAI